jgi:putative GTP pyrophosphokinase
MNDKETFLLNQFNSVKPELRIWGTYVDEQLKNVVLSDPYDLNFVKIFPQNRLKSDQSFLFKALYRKRIYIDPILEIEDKIGTRVVLLKSDEIEKVAEVICNHIGWQSKITKNLKNELEDQPKLFDYQSLHIVVWPNDDYGYDGDKKVLTCEIQIRTLLQHAFAEVSHDSAYKGPYKNDVEIIRHLAKSMALMEATDDYFTRIFTLMSDEQREYSNYTKELMRIYKEFFPDFDKHQLNFDLTERVYELLSDKKVELNLLEAFVERQKQAITSALNPKNGLLFEQPVSILLSYYLFHHKTFLEENWPLNHESLLGLFRAYNMSTGNY